MTVGFALSGEVGEIFLNADRANSMLDVLMSDAAIIASIAAIGVMNSNRPSRDSSTPSIVLMSGKSAPNVPALAQRES